MLAFSSQTYSPGTVRDVEFLVPAGWLLLLIALGSGLAHVRLSVAILKLAMHRLDRVDQVRDLQTMLDDNVTGPIRSLETGELTDVATSRQQLSELRATIAAMHSEKEAMQARQRVLAKLRNSGLLAGLAALAAWRFAAFALAP